jgi:hypothetical protein
MPEALSMQGIQFGVRERAAPRVIDHRATLRSDRTAQLLVSSPDGHRGARPAVNRLVPARIHTPRTQPIKGYPGPPAEL